MSSIPSVLPPHLWAKSGKKGEPGESLSVHTFAVAERLSQLALRSPGLAAIAGDERLWHRAFWACWLHDLGKSARAFQAYLRGQRGPWEHRHEVLSLAFLGWVAPPESDDFSWIAGAIASHHRDARLIVGERYDPGLPLEDLDLEAMVAELEDQAIHAIHRWLSETAPTWLAGSALASHQVGPPATVPARLDLPSLRRSLPDAIHTALRAYQRLWRAQAAAPARSGTRRQALILRGLVLLSDHLASAHSPPLQPLALPDAAALLARAGVADGRPRSHQELASRTEGSIVLAAPTGSGKTEAALLWARRQQEARHSCLRLIYVLPYQASSNAMRLRLSQQLGAEVGLLHSRSAQVLYREYCERGYAGRAAERAALRAVDLARLHQPPVWVATPYQLLRAAYRLPGYEIAWAALGNALLVLDEPHAYEPKRLGLILGLLGELVRHWGVRVCAISATMPSWLRQVLTSCLEATMLPIDPPLFAAFRRHRLELLPGMISDPQVVERIVEQVESGCSVLVGVNTVERAREMRRVLASRLGEARVRLLHGRFTARDRLRKEAEVMERLQAGSRTSVALAVVATQVVEVSLDLDFDAIVSEPAALEALAQRFGRVNRRGRKGAGGIVPVWVTTEPADGQGVYDQRLVARTLDVLRSRDGDVLDEALLSGLLDQIYGGDLAQEYVDEAERFRGEFEASCLQALRAFESDESLADLFDRLFDGAEVLPASLEAEYRRIAEESILAAQSLLVPVRTRHLARLGQRVRWSPGLGLRVVDAPYDPDLGLELPDWTGQGRRAPLA